jgi:predicted transcriptional regulator
MDFTTAAKYASLLSKDYAADVFSLLVNYQAISSSEVASRLDLHIKTAQDFLEGFTQLGVLEKEEVLEQKRPYYRYYLKEKRLVIDIDLEQVRQPATHNNLILVIREKEDTAARFTLARDGNHISSVTIWSGEGRERSERRIKLTTPQGRFLYHLPFPKTTPLSIVDIMHKASLDESLAPEILDLTQMLENYGVIEIISLH